MTIRKKVFLIVGTVFFGLVAILLFIGLFVGRSSLDRLETEYGRYALETFRTALDSQMADLDSLTADWAYWDDTYEFVQDGNQDYIDSNLMDGTFVNVNLNLMVIADANDRVTFMKYFDPEQTLEQQPPSDLPAHFTPKSILFERPQESSKVAGLIMVQGKPMLVTSLPILTSAEKGPIQGSLTVGRFLLSSSVDELVAVRHVLTLWPFGAPDLPSDFQIARDELVQGRTSLIRPLDDQILASYALLRDVYDEPIVIARLDSGREIYQHGQSVLTFFAASLLAIGAVFGGVLFLVLDRLILKRLEQLDRDVKRIGSERDPTVRVTVSGQDELTGLGQSINLMLDSLAQSQKRLLESEVFLRQVFNTTPNLMFVKDKNGRYLQVNRAWSEFYAMLMGEAIGKTDRDLAELGRFLHSEAERFRQDDLRVLENGEMLFLDDVSVTKENGRTYWFHVAKVPLTLHDDPHHVLAICTEVTERKRLEAQLLQSQKLESVGRLAGGVAHDFNNLLTVIIGNSEIILERLSMENSVSKNVEQILLSAERASQLVRQLLLFSRQTEIETSAANLNDAILEVKKMLDRLIGEDITLVTVLEPALNEVEIDSGQMEQVLINLAVNARDAMPHGGTLIVRTENVTLSEDDGRKYTEVPPGEYVQLTVSDSGLGMDSDILAHIFEPFFTTKAAGKGTGLGLAMVYGIVKRHEGYILAESQPGQGTTFTIYLPRATAKEHQRQKEGSLDDVPRGTETILLVEDENLVRQVMAQILRGLGYSVIEAASGEEAWQLIRSGENGIALVLTDIVMPYMTGKELANQIRKLYPEMKVLFTSGHIDHDTLRDLNAEDENIFLRKPLTVATVASKVREILDQPMSFDSQAKT